MTRPRSTSLASFFDAIGAAIARRPRPWIIVLYVGAVVVSTLQRGVFDHSHTTFPIFRQSYHHLVAGQDLYAAYPTEQGTDARDLFKYSPTAALLFGAFALPAFAVGLLLWNLLNAAVVFVAIDQLLPRRASNFVLVLAFPAILSALQSSSSNALVAGLIVLAFVSFERGRQFGAAAAIGIGTLVKLFPLSAVMFAISWPRRTRFAGLLLLVFTALLAAPLLVTSPQILAEQYHAWWRLVMSDSADLQFGNSLIRVVRFVFQFDVPNWPVQLAATLVLVAPGAASRNRLPGRRVRRLSLCSLLLYVVIFNHQAEHQSFAIASVGLAVWYVTSTRTVWRTAIVILCVAGLDAVPYFLAWLTIQADLWRALSAHPLLRRTVPARVFALTNAPATARLFAQAREPNRDVRTRRRPMPATTGYARSIARDHSAQPGRLQAAGRSAEFVSASQA